MLHILQISYKIFRISGYVNNNLMTLLCSLNKYFNGVVHIVAVSNTITEVYVRYLVATKFI